MFLVSIFDKTWKTSFLTHWPLLLWKPQNKIKVNVSYSFVKTLCWCNFMQKIRKIPCVDFSQNLKNLILGLFWALLTQKPQNKTLQKIQLYLFKLHDILTSCKKSETFYWRLQRKSPEKRTNWQTDRGYFPGPSIWGFKKRNKSATSRSQHGIITIHMPCKKVLEVLKSTMKATEQCHWNAL